jgi:hypothetical protein
MESHPKLAGDNLGKRRFAKSRRADEKHMIERLAPGSRRLNEDPEIIPRSLLASEIRQGHRAQRHLRIIIALFRGHEARAF